MSIVKSFDNAFKKMHEQGWDKIYVLVDIHDTIFRACYDNDETYEMFPFAEHVLRILSYKKNISLILWTSSYQNKIADYIKKLKSMGIRFDMVNANFEVANTKLSCFDEKLYFNVGIDDKFGFDAEHDWGELWDYFVKREPTIINEYLNRNNND